MAQMDGAVSYCFWEICSKKYWSSGEYPFRSSNWKASFTHPVVFSGVTACEWNASLVCTHFSRNKMKTFWSLSLVFRNFVQDF